MYGSEEDRGPLCLAIVTSMLILGGVFVFARVISRTIIKPQFGWDDGLIVITWFIILGYAIAMYFSLSYGYGKHYLTLSPSDQILCVRAEVIGQFLAISSFPTGKASIAVLLLRIFPGRKLQWFLWIFVAANAIFFYVDAVLVLVQCQPVEFQWDHTIPGGKCWTSNIVVGWGYLTGVTGALTDFLFAIIPGIYIWKLKMGLKEKISICAALSMGFFAAACSILKIYYTGTLGAHADFTFDTTPLVIWSCVELAAINVGACIPTLRPLYLVLTGKDVNGPKTTGSTKGTSFGGGRSTHNSSRLGVFGAEGSTSSATRLDSEDSTDRNIYQFKEYNVSFKDREEQGGHSPTPVGGMSTNASANAYHAC